ncbi:MAG: hypothetical protein ACM3ZE_30545, partial [Myxococcales bacterium]
MRQIISDYSSSRVHDATLHRPRLGRIAHLVFLPGLIAGCSADETTLTSERVAIAHQAQTLPTFGSPCRTNGECAVQISVPEGVPETQMALSATTFVHINDRAGVSSVSGITPVAASGGEWARIGAQATSGHFMSPRSPLQVGPTNKSKRKLYGNLYSGGAEGDMPLGKQLGEQGIVHTGKLIEPIGSSEQPSMEINTIWSFMWPTVAATNPIEQNKPGTYYLTPHEDQAYADVTIGSGQIVQLEPGTYFFNSLTLNSGGKLVANTSSGQLVRLAVAGSVNLNANVVEQRATGSGGVEEPTRFLMAYVGRSAGFNANRGIEAMVVAPDAHVAVWGLRGAAFGKSVEVHQDVQVLAGIHPDLLKNPGTKPGPRLPDSELTHYVSRLGYLDGRSCEHWPLDLKPAEYVSALSVDASSETKAAAQKILAELQRVTQTAEPAVTAFGSMSELVVTTYTEYSEATKGLERRAIAVDPLTKRGYELSYARLCREADELKQGLCSARSMPVSINGQAVTVDVLGRSSPDERVGATDESIKSVELVAPTVRFEPLWDNPRLYGHSYFADRLELDVNLILAANKVVVGKDGSSNVIDIEVRPYAAATAATWATDLNAPSRPGLLAVLGSTVNGLRALATVNGARVSQVTCYPAPGYTAPSGGDSSQLVTNWRVSPYTNATYVTRTTPELHLTSTLFPSALPFRSAQEAGGFVGVVGLASSPADLIAPSMDGVLDYGCPIEADTSSRLLPSTLAVNASETGLQTAQVFSNGWLFRSMVNAADAASLSQAEGRPAQQYTQVRAALDTIDPTGSTKIGIDAATQGRVRALADAAERPDEAVSLNALGVPHGAIARPWLPNNVSTSTARSVDELIGHWKDVTSTVDKLTAAMAEQAGSDQFEELITAAGALVKGLRTYAVDTNQSAIQDTLGQEAAIKTALAANEALEANQKKFFDGMCDELQLDRTPPYDPGKECTWELISATVKAKAKAVVDACAEKNKSGGWLDALNAIAAVCPYVSAGVTAFKGFNTLLKKGEQGETYLKLLVPKSSDAFKGSLQAMRDNEGWINLVGKAAEGFNKGKGKVKSGLDTLGLLNEDCPSLSGEAAAARAMLMNLRTSLALVDSMAVEAQTIEAITVSSTSTLHFQVANEQANANLITVADDAVTTVKKWNKDAAAEKRAQYIAEGCAIARESVRAGQVELIDMAHRLQTAAGWPRTSPLPVIPRRAVGSSTDVSVPLITTLWAPIAISSWFDTMTNSGSIADAAAQRFVSLVDLVTNKGTSEGDAIPSMIFYVKKRVTGPDLEYFKNYGNLKFAVGLEDLVRSGNEFDYWDARITGESWLPLLSSTWLPLSTPYALAVAYSGCFGADPLEPCCTGAGCRGKVIGNAPWSTRLGTAAMPTTSGCTSPEEWSTSASPLEQTTRSSGGKTTALFDTRTC